MNGNDLMFGDERGNYTHSNLTLRDHIAIEAMNGELASQSEEVGDWPDRHVKELAERCYKIADAMILESNKANGE